MQTTLGRLRLALVYMLALFFVASIRADVHYVLVYENSFSPSFLEVHPDDSVTWINYDEFFPHSIASDNSAWLPPGYLFDEGDMYTQVFGSIGSYGYHDGFDNFGGTISVVAATTGSPETSTLSAPALAGGQFQFTFSTISGRSYAVEYSTNLVDWQAFDSQTASGSSVSFTDTNAVSSPHRFYRVKSE